MKTAELHTAYQWDCEECGQENFCRAVVWEITQDDAAFMQEQYGEAPEGPWTTGNWVSVPAEVTCSRCGMTFATTESE